MEKIIQTIQILFIGLSIVSCAGTNTVSVDPHMLKTLSYGDSLELVNKKIGDKGELLIKSSQQDGEYSAYVVIPDQTFTPFLFLYHNNELLSISLFEKYLSELYKRFTYNTVFNYEEFENTKTKLITDRIDPPDYSFELVDGRRRLIEEKKRKHETGEWIMWAPVMVLAAPVTGPIAAKEYNKDRAQQLNWENISTGDFKEEILKILGTPTHTKQIGNPLQEIHFYKRFNGGYRQVSFQKGKVVWILSDHYFKKK